jgi:transketolase
VQGDREVSEGALWEAIAIVGLYKLNNLVAIVTINCLGQNDAA